MDEPQTTQPDPQDPSYQISCISSPDTLSNEATFNPKPNPLKSIGQFILGEKLGEGTFGTVRLATHIETNEQVAIKILEKVKILQLEDKTRVEREIKILKYLRHNNIAQLYSVIQTNENICLVIEYVQGKELFDYIIENKHLSEMEACCFYQQIISGIEYLHKLRVVHRDLKPENLLIDTKNTIKIVDFGLSIDYGDDDLLSTACGSPCYAAPEMLVGKKYVATGVDIWSSGIVLYAMLTGFLPFDDTDNDALYKKITQGRFEMPENISEAAKDLIRRILTTDPQNRISIYQIKRHPWFNLTSPKLTISQGLLMNLYVIPIDEELIDQMAHFGYKKEEVRSNVLSNRHNQITTSYYLLLRRMIKENKPSIADLKSDKFGNYIKDKRNLFSNYNNDFNNVIATRSVINDYANAKTETCPVSMVTKHKRYMSMTVSAENKDKNSMKKTQGSADMVGLKTNSLRKKREMVLNTLINEKGGDKNHHVKKNNMTETKEEPSLTQNSSIRRYDDKDGSLKAKKANRHKVSYSLDMDMNMELKAKNALCNKKQPNRAIFVKANTHLATTANSNDEKEYLNTIQGFGKGRMKANSNSKQKGSVLNVNKEKYKSKSRKGISVKYRQDMKLCITPFDLCCISLNPLSVIKDKIIQLLNKRKIKYRTPKNKFLCETNHMQFSLEIIKNNDIVNAYIIQLKRIEGLEETYKAVTANLLERLSL